MARSVRRILLRAPFAAALAGLVLAPSCAGAIDEKSECTRLCEKGQDECPLPRVDCQGQCLYEDARAEKTNCHDEVDAVARCSGKLDDICTTRTACDPEIDAFWACIGRYCAGHPSSRYCDDEPGGT